LEPLLLIKLLTNGYALTPFQGCELVNGDLKKPSMRFLLLW